MDRLATANWTGPWRTDRRIISDDVTGVLVVRGAAEVVTSVAANKGARFSSSGFLHLLKRSEDDHILTEHLGLRKDIPRQLFQQLISKASDEVKRKLERERPEMGNHIQAVVTDVTGAVHARFGPASKTYFAAKRTVAKLHQYGSLKEDRVFEFAYSLKFGKRLARRKRSYCGGIFVRGPDLVLGGVILVRR